MNLQSKEKDGISYIDTEKGDQVLFLLHGLMGTLSNFEVLIDFFTKKGFRIVAPTLPIYSLPMLRLTVSHIGKVVSEFIHSLDLKNIHIIGNSLGGHIGLVVAKNNPHVVDTLTLTGSSGLYEKAFGNTFPKRNNYEYVKAKAESVFYNPACATKELVDSVFEVTKDRMKTIKTIRLSRNAIRYNMASELHEITMPVSLIWGKQDQVTPPDVAKEFHRLLPDSSLFWLDKCGHAPMMELPHEFNETLLKWLTEKGFVK